MNVALWMRISRKQMRDSGFTHGGATDGLQKATLEEDDGEEEEEEGRIGEES